MKLLETEITIKGDISDVWDVLTDFSRYPEWNPFLTRIEGKLKAREKLTVTAHPSSSVGRTFYPVVSGVDEGREFRWIGRLALPNLLDGEHIFRLESDSSGVTKFIHNEEFQGLMIPLHGFFRWKHTVLGFNEMNEALKQRVEGQR